jgi:tRNA pseudouridine38-40 synthase
MPALSEPPATDRWALLLEYDGTDFVGWQHQGSGLSVQDVVEQAALRLARGVPPATMVAGRTDAGVHAAGQVVQLTLPAGYAAERVRDALNFHMKPHPVVVLRAALSPAGWSARFSARSRLYRYRILNRRARPALAVDRVWHVPHPLDAEAMAEGARYLLGQHDFTSFRASACQAKSPLRTLDRLDVLRTGEVIELVAEARSFLHHQVRNMAGTLKLVGEGRWPPERVAAALAARDRAAAGPTAPAAGLTFLTVRYDEDPFSPAPR